MVHELAIGIVIIVKILIVNHQHEIQFDFAGNIQLDSFVWCTVVVYFAGQVDLILTAEVVHEDHVGDQVDQERIDHEGAGAAQEGLVMSFAVLGYLDVLPKHIEIPHNLHKRNFIQETGACQ